MRRIAVLLVLVAIGVVGPVAAAGAHPLGNFTVNRYAGVVIHPDRVAVRYVVDMAEIPAFQERRSIDADRDGVVSGPEGIAYADRSCDRLGAGVRLGVDGEALPLARTASAVAFPPGAAGLVTLRLECDFEGGLAASRATRELVLHDGNFAGRIGWREITATTDGTTIVASTVPRESASAELTRYPQDLLTSPLAVSSAVARFRAGGDATIRGHNTVAPSFLPRGVDRATQAFTSFISRRHFTAAFFFAAVLLALLLGAVHALAPGHGKTLMAAYLLGEDGSLRQGAIIGLSVTATHTAGVLVLGLVISASSALAPERLYPILGVASGALMLAIGAGLLRRALRRRAATRHRHASALHEHGHALPAGIASTRSLLGVGFAGGLVPSPSALVVLLGALALGRLWVGIVLVVCYGLGMAATLSGAGLVLVKVRRRLERRRSEGVTTHPRIAPLLRALPVATALIVLVTGVALTARGVAKI